MFNRLGHLTKNEYRCTNRNPADNRLLEIFSFQLWLDVEQLYIFSSRVAGTMVARSSHLCACMWGSDRLRVGCQEVGKCSTRGESWGMYITFVSAKIANKAEPTLALKPRGEVTRNPKQGYQWPQKRTCVRQKLFLKKLYI